MSARLGISSDYEELQMASQTHLTASTRVDRPGDLPAPSPEVSSQAYTRLVVLVPEGAIDYGKLYHELSELIIPSVCEIVYIGLGQNRSTSPVSRRLTELTLVAPELPVYQRKRIIDAGSWAEAVHIVAQPGDLIVCQANRQDSRLVEELSQLAPSPVRVLVGLQLPLSTRMARALKSLIFNLFPFIVIAAFFWLQVQIDAQSTGLVRTLAIVMTVLVELGVIFVWSLFIP
jgi:hypothetical protein